MPASLPILPLQDVNEKEFYRQFDTNVLEFFLPPNVRQSQFGEKGRLHHQHRLGSKHSDSSRIVDLRATKSAVDGITRVLAKELGPRKHPCELHQPGVIDTEGARAMETYEQVANAIRAETPLGRTGMPEDIG